jgi:uncharacterized protein YcbX
MHIEALWRYPVKSLGGEPLESAALTSDGVAGDRRIHVGSGTGVLTGRTRHRLLALRGATAADGVPLVNGHRWDSDEAAALIRDAAGPEARLVAYDGPARFDVTNLLIATDGAIARFGHDPRRLRPNLVLAGAPLGMEDALPGRALRIGDAVVGVLSKRQRCIVTSIDPDTGEQDLEIFRGIRRDFGNELALNCWVVRPGTVRVGDPVDLALLDAEPEHLGGWIVGAPYDIAG